MGHRRGPWGKTQIINNNDSFAINVVKKKVYTFYSNVIYKRGSPIVNYVSLYVGGRYQVR